MAEQNQNSNQQVIVYALVAITVLLLAIVGFMVYNQVSNKTASTGGSATTAADAAAASVAAQMPAPSASTTPFDPKTATKLPAGMTPEQAMKAYSDDVMGSKWAEAYKLLPLDTQKTYGTADAMGQQLKSYGITGFKQGKPTTSGTDVNIVLEEDTPMMNITYTWTYKQVGGDWFVAGRQKGGSVQ